MVDGLLNNKIAFIIQARMQSSRLPGKILMPLPFGGKISLLGHIVESVKKSKSNYSITVATSVNAENDVLVPFCESQDIACFRGAEEDVLSRFNSILEGTNYDLVVRLTADNPFVDVELLDTIIIKHIESGADYTTSQGLPLGMNFEVVSASALQSLSSKVLTDQDKEHVTLFIKNSGLYKLNIIKPIEKEVYNQLRLTVDYPSDYIVASALFTIYLSSKISLGLPLIDYCLEKYPWLFEINQSNFQKQN
jgi:spore coat polysaccharide biosynthesis protein SpsF